MTALQQALVHLAVVVVVVAAVLVLALTGNLTTEALTIVLAVAGISSTGVAAVSPTVTTVAAPAAQPVARVPSVPTS